MHAHAPHVQSAWQIRVCIPHMVPQAAPISIAPGAHAPPPLHKPSSVHTPDEQTWRCVPQRAQAIVRGGSPVVQSHVEGAVHAAQMPSVQRSTPVPQPEVHVRSEVRPTLAMLSSQSIAEGMPS